MAAKTNTNQKGGQWKRYNARLLTVAQWLRESGYNADAKKFDSAPIVARVLSTWDYFGHNDRAEALVNNAMALARGERVIGVNGGRPKGGNMKAVMRELARAAELAREVREDMRLRKGAYLHTGSELSALLSAIESLAETYKLEPAE